MLELNIATRAGILHEESQESDATGTKVNSSFPCLGTVNVLNVEVPMQGAGEREDSIAEAGDEE